MNRTETNQGAIGGLKSQPTEDPSAADSGKTTATSTTGKKSASTSTSSKSPLPPLTDTHHYGSSVDLTSKDGPSEKPPLSA